MSLASNFIQHLYLTPEDNAALAALCGPQDSHLRRIERDLSVTLYNRGHAFQIEGAEENTQQTKKVLTQLYEKLHNQGNHPSLTTQQLATCLRKQQVTSGVSDDNNRMTATSLILQTPRKSIRPRTINQTHYLTRIEQFDINFGIGPAGTGKTYLAVASAVAALEQQKVNRIILVRPAVEAGEKLGFLPGDFAQKLDPYFRPLYDALYEMLGFKQTMRFIESHIIEIAPLAYMRGRTLNDAFIILDEAQNTTREQMKMFLTRIGLHSNVVISGDITQTDLPHGGQSGLQHCLPLLKKIKDIGFTYFTTDDIVRHPLIQAILQAYEKNAAAEN